jgi:hypothetical protein
LATEEDRCAERSQVPGVVLRTNQAGLDQRGTKKKPQANPIRYAKYTERAYEQNGFFSDPGASLLILVLKLKTSEFPNQKKN